MPLGKSDNGEDLAGTPAAVPTWTSVQGCTTPQPLLAGLTHKRALTASWCQGWVCDPGPDTESRFYALPVSVLPANNHPQMPSRSLESVRFGLSTTVNSPFRPIHARFAGNTPL